MFQEKKYKIIKNAISKELANFIHDYFLLKRKVTSYLIDAKYLAPFRDDYGHWRDDQVPNTYSHYADIVMETLLEKLNKKMNENVGFKVIPTYSYARIYKKGDILERHKDRFSCEISTTLNIGGDSWPIYLEPNKNVGFPGENGCTFNSNNLGIKVDLEPGDMLIYSGCILEHWREEFKGDYCIQVFLHYNKDIDKGRKNIYDGRPFLGLPTSFKTKKVI